MFFNIPNAIFPFQMPGGNAATNSDGNRRWPWMPWMMNPEQFMQFMPQMMNPEQFMPWMVNPEQFMQFMSQMMNPEQFMQFKSQMMNPEQFMQFMPQIPGMPGCEQMKQFMNSSKNMFSKFGNIGKDMSAKGSDILPFGMPIELLQVMLNMNSTPEGLSKYQKVLDLFFGSDKKQPSTEA